MQLKAIELKRKLQEKYQSQEEIKKQHSQFWQAVQYSFENYHFCNEADNNKMKQLWEGFVDEEIIQLDYKMNEKKITKQEKMRLKNNNFIIPKTTRQQIIKLIRDTTDIGLLLFIVNFIQFSFFTKVLQPNEELLTKKLPVQIIRRLTLFDDMQSISSLDKKKVKVIQFIMIFRIKYRYSNTKNMSRLLKLHPKYRMYLLEGCDQIYHLLHKQAEIKKKTLLRDIYRSKCFVCDCEGFESGSRYKVKMYQCVNRQIGNMMGEVDFE